MPPNHRTAASVTCAIALGAVFACPIPRAAAQEKPGTLPAIPSPSTDGKPPTQPALDAASSGPRGRAAVLVWSPEKGSTGYDPTSTPRPGQRLLVRADASVPASILIAAFDKATRRLAHDLRPVFATRAEPFEEVAFPDGDAPWKFEAKAEPIEVFVVTFAAGDARAETARKLAQSLAAETDRTTVNRQAKALHQMILDLARGRDPSQLQPRHRPPGRAAVTRSIGSGISWQRNLARSAPLTDDGAPAILLFSVGD